MNLYIAVAMVFALVSKSAFAQIAVESVSDIGFGGIIFTQDHSATLRLGTNGSLSVSGTGIETSGTSSAGEISITSEDAGTVEIRCSSSGALASVGEDSIQMGGAEVSVNTGRAFGSGEACSGVNASLPAVSYSLSASVPATVLIGVELDLVNGHLSGSGEYSSGVAGGSPIEIDVVFQ